MTCPLCGYKFTDHKVTCSSCPLHSDCKLICCPNCGYQFPQDSQLVTRIKSFILRRKKDVPADE